MILAAWNVVIHYLVPIGIAFSVVVVIHEWGHFLVARAFGVRVDRFSLGFGPEIFGLTRGDTRYSLSIIPLGGYVKLAGEAPEDEDHTGAPDEFSSQPWHTRAWIVLAGPVSSLLLAALLFGGVAWRWGTTVPSDAPVIGQVIPDGPAAAAGLHPGDKVLSVTLTGRGGHTLPVTSWKEMAAIIHARADRPLRFLIERQQAGTARAARLTITLTPKLDPHHNQGLIGVTPESIQVHFGLFQSLWEGGRQTFLWVVLTLKFLGMMILRLVSPDVAGPLGIAQVVAKAARNGLQEFLYMIALISTSLGLFNLFPIPLLDGGHIAMAVLEGAMGKPLSPRLTKVAQSVGLVILLAILVFATYSDIARLRSGLMK